MLSYVLDCHLNVYLHILVLPLLSRTLPSFIGSHSKPHKPFTVPDVVLEAAHVALCTRECFHSLLQAEARLAYAVRRPQVHVGDFCPRRQQMAGVMALPGHLAMRTRHHRAKRFFSDRPVVFG